MTFFRSDTSRFIFEINVGKRRIRHRTTTLEIKKFAISVSLANRQKVNQFSMHLTHLRTVPEHQKMKMQQFQLHSERKNELPAKKFFQNQNQLQIKQLRYQPKQSWLIVRPAPLEAKYESYNISPFFCPFKLL